MYNTVVQCPWQATRMNMGYDDLRDHELDFISTEQKEKNNNSTRYCDEMPIINAKGWLVAFFYGQNLGVLRSGSLEMYQEWK